jgi:hypothetical protein
VLARTSWVSGGSLHITSPAVDMPLGTAALVLCAHACVTLVVAANYMHTLTSQNREARRRLLVQAWFLEQIAAPRG